MVHMLLISYLRQRARPANTSVPATSAYRTTHIGIDLEPRC